MSKTPYRDDQRLAFAVTRFIEDVHRRVPQARIEPMTPYDNEDFTLAVIVPAGTDEEVVLDQCLAASAAIEDEIAIEENSSPHGLHLAGQVRPSPFTELRILPIITTSTADLVQDFFQPLLLRSVAYDRGVGFFSAGCLRINAVRLAGLVRNGGQARWITSPTLSREEWKALRRGVEASSNPALCRAFQGGLVSRWETQSAGLRSLLD